MTFNERIAAHLHHQKAKRGLTNLEMAQTIGLPKGNYISMLMQQPGSQSPLAMKRVKMLAEGFDLTCTEAAELVLLRAKHHPDAATAIDLPTTLWMAKTIEQARKERAEARKKRDDASRKDLH